MASLARCVGDATAFLERRFTAEPHLHHGGPFDDLLSLADVDRLLAGDGLRHPALRLVQDGEPVPRAAWTRRARTGSVWIDDLVDAGAVLDRFAGGATVVLQSLQRWWPPLTALCDDLAAALGHRTQANAYLTPAGAAGLAPHHDTHDVFVLQVHGTKHWTVRERTIEAPLDRHRSERDAAASLPVVLEADLQPGDCLYLPRGQVHSARAQEGASLHITVGVLATTGHDVLRRLVDRAADDVAFRRALPVGWAGDRQLTTAAVKGVLAELAAWLERVDPDELAGDLLAAAPRRTSDRGGRLVELAGLGDLGDGDVVHRAAGELQLAEAGEVVAVVASDRRVELPAALAPALRLLLDGAPHAIGELDPWLDEGSRLVLARRLVREGVLRVAGGGRG